MNGNISQKPPRIIQLFATIFLIIAGTTLLFCALFTPPIGQIHPTVLAAYGMILTFVGTVLGIDYNYKLKEFSFFSAFEQRNKKNSPKNKIQSNEKD